MASASGARTATLVAHDTGLPVASHGFHDESGERTAIAALFEEVSLAGHVITVDVPHTVRDTARSIVESHNADYLMTVKANAPETFEIRDAQHDQLEPRCDRGV